MAPTIVCTDVQVHGAEKLSVFYESLDCLDLKV